MYPVGRRVCAVLHSKFYYPSVSEMFLPWCVSSGQEGVCCFEQEVLLPQCLWTVHTSVCNQWARRCVLYWTASSITPVSLKCPYLGVYPVGRRVCAVLHSKFCYPSVSEVSIPQCVSIGRRVCAVLNSNFYLPSVSEVSIPQCVSIGRRVCAVLNSKFYYPSVSEVSLPWCVPSGQEGVCCTEQQVLLPQCLWSVHTSVCIHRQEGVRCTEQQVLLPQCLWSVHTSVCIHRQEGVRCTEQQVLLPQCLWSVLTLVCTQWAGGCALYWTASSITPVSLKCPYLGVYPVGRRVCAVLNSKFYYPSVSEVSIPQCVSIGRRVCAVLNSKFYYPSVSEVSIPWCVSIGRRVCAVLNSKFYYPSVSEVSLPWCVPSGQEGVCCTEQQVLSPQCLWSIHTLVCNQWAGGCALYWTASSITPVTLKCPYLGV